MVRVWIREQRKIESRSKALLSLWWQTWTSPLVLLCHHCCATSQLVILNIYRVTNYLKWLPSLPGIVMEINKTEVGVVTMTTRVADRGTKTEAEPRIRTERGRTAAEKTRLEYLFKECIRLTRMFFHD